MSKLPAWDELHADALRLITDGGLIAFIARADHRPPVVITVITITSIYLDGIIPSVARGKFIAVSSPALVSARRTPGGGYTDGHIGVYRWDGSGYVGLNGAMDLGFLDFTRLDERVASGAPKGYPQGSGRTDEEGRYTQTASGERLSDGNQR